MNLLTPSYIGVAIIGLLHGLEPGHGWPVALIYSMGKRKPLLSGIISSGIIAFAHFTSSIAVAVVYVLLSSWLKLNLPFLDYVAAALLLWLAFQMFREKPGEQGTNEHQTRDSMSLWALASFAFILGFAHEEEFALLALVVAGANAFVLMALYGIAVSLAIIGVTVISIKVYGLLEPRIKRYESYIPKVSALVLVIMAVYIIFW